MKEFLGLRVPIFMPDATLGAVRSITTKQLEETGTKMVVVNTLHLLLTAGVERTQAVGGIQKFMHWNGKVLSDSGGFQVFSLVHRNSKMGKVTQYGLYVRSPFSGERVLLTPEISVDMQVAIGADVMIVLDDCRGHDVSRKDAEESVRRTTTWARRAKDHLLRQYPEVVRSRRVFAVVQGGSFLDLRRRSAEELQEVGFDGYCFGGWPVGGDGKLAVRELEEVAELIPDSLPKYAMGVGTPSNISACVKLGYSMFDCVLPTRNARHGLLYTSEGLVRITKAEYANENEPVDKECPCELCTSYSRAYLHHLFRTNELTGKTLATIHNLTHYSHFMQNL